MRTELEKLILWLNIRTALYMSVRVYGLDCVEREMRASSRHFRAGLDYTDDCKQTNDFVVESLFFCVFFFLYFCLLYWLSHRQITNESIPSSLHSVPSYEILSLLIRLCYDISLYAPASSRLLSLLIGSR